ncbi:hypothetical protein WN51_02720 [Melipona quadrifasciata]|uniref:Uncharacterized protein n=1 Tax=Melipona quadrifasciata TaxID=166423 RepID=A0A0M9A8K6_9HYME|nr:hypothetical protein WN51_02720 [Melipona quadrifasciata]
MEKLSGIAIAKILNSLCHGSYAYVNKWPKFSKMKEENEDCRDGRRGKGRSEAELRVEEGERQGWALDAFMVVTILYEKENGADVITRKLRLEGKIVNNTTLQESVQSLHLTRANIIGRNDSWNYYEELLQISHFSIFPDTKITTKHFRFVILMYRRNLSLNVKVKVETNMVRYDIKIVVVVKLIEEKNRLILYKSKTSEVSLRFDFFNYFIFSVNMNLQYIGEYDVGRVKQRCKNSGNLNISSANCNNVQCSNKTAKASFKESRCEEKTSVFKTKLYQSYYFWVPLIHLCVLEYLIDDNRLASLSSHIFTCAGTKSRRSNRDKNTTDTEMPRSPERSTPRLKAEFSPLRWEEKERDRGFSSIIMDTHHPTLISFHRETIYNVPSGTRIIRTTLEKSLIGSGWGSRDLPGKHNGKLTVSSSIEHCVTVFFKFLDRMSTSIEFLPSLN